MRFIVDHSNLLSWPLFAAGTMDLDEAPYCVSILRPGETFVDVGANWGYYTLLASDKVGCTGRIVAIEADPRNYALLHRTITLNHLKQVECIQIAVGPESGTVQFVTCPENLPNQGISHIKGLHRPTSLAGNRAKMESNIQQVFNVEARPLDLILKEANIHHVDLLKMDIEGAEALAVQGMKQGLNQQTYRRIFLELHSNLLHEYNSSLASITEFLRSFGYQIFHYQKGRVSPFKIDNATEPRPLIVALAESIPVPA